MKDGRGEILRRDRAIDRIGGMFDRAPVHGAATASSGSGENVRSGMEKDRKKGLTLEKTGKGTDWKRGQDSGLFTGGA